MRAYTPFFLYLRNGWMDCAKIRRVLRGPLAKRFTGIASGAHRMCATRAHPFYILATTERFVVKLGVLDTN